MNSPGSASRAPSAKARAQQQLQHHRRAVRGNLHQILCGIGVGRGKEGDHGLVDAASGVLVEHIGQAGAGVFERLAQTNELRGDGGGLGPLRRTMPMPPRPGGVEMAAIVSMLESAEVTGWKQCR